MKMGIPALAGFALIISSCSKQELNPNKQIQVQKQFVKQKIKIESNISVPQDELFLKISAVKATSQFKKQIGMQTTSGTSAPNLPNMRPDETIYFTEATLNFDHYRAYHSQINFENHLAQKTLSLNSSGEINGVDVTTLYDYFSDEISNNIPNGKEVLIADVWISDLSEDQAVFEMEITYSETSPFELDPLSLDDDWHPIAQDGKCDNTMLGKDAADRLEQLYNWYTPSGWNGSSTNSIGGWETGCATNTSGTWSGIHSFEYFGGNAPGTSQSQYFFPFNGCLEPCWTEVDMEDNLVDGFTHMALQIPSQSDFIRCTMVSEVHGTGGCPGAPGTNAAGIHIFNVKYGVHTCGQLPD